MQAAERVQDQDGHIEEDPEHGEEEKRSDAGRGEKARDERYRGRLTSQGLCPEEAQVLLVLKEVFIYYEGGVSRASFSFQPLTPPLQCRNFLQMPPHPLFFLLQTLYTLTPCSSP